MGPPISSLWWGGVFNNQDVYTEDLLGAKKNNKGNKISKSAWEAKKDQEPKELKNRVENIKIAKA